jgi:hypothetical protein
MASSKNIKIDKKILKVTVNKAQEEQTVPVLQTDVALPDDSPARMKTLRAEGRKWYLTVVYHQNTENPFALFCTTNHREKTAQTSGAVESLLELASQKGILDEHIQKLVGKIEHEPNVQKLTRTISLLLRHNVSIADIVFQLEKLEGCIRRVLLIPGQEVLVSVY